MSRESWRPSPLSPRCSASTIWKEEASSTSARAADCSRWRPPGSGQDLSIRSDYDEDSVACTAALRERFLADKEDWHVERGDVTDGAYCAGLGCFDVVYSWGVLHHSGALWRALENTVGSSRRVASFSFLSTTTRDDGASAGAESSAGTTPFRPRSKSRMPFSFRHPGRSRQRHAGWCAVAFARTSARGRSLAREV